MGTDAVTAHVHTWTEEVIPLGGTVRYCTECNTMIFS